MIITASQAQKRISDSLERENQEQNSEITKLIEDAISYKRYECVFCKPLTDTIRDELKNKGYKLINQGAYTIISWYPPQQSK